MKKIFMFLYLLITINILGMEEIKVSYPKGRVDFSFYQNLEEDKYKGKYVDLFDFLNKDKKYKFKYQIEKKDEKNLADIQIRKLGNFDSNYSYIETAYIQRIYVIAKKGVDLKNIDEKENLRVGYFGKGIEEIERLKNYYDTPESDVTIFRDEEDIYYALITGNIDIAVIANLKKSSNFPDVEILTTINVKEYIGIRKDREDLYQLFSKNIEKFDNKKLLESNKKNRIEYFKYLYKDTPTYNDIKIRYKDLKVLIPDKEFLPYYKSRGTKSEGVVPYIGEEIEEILRVPVRYVLSKDEAWDINGVDFTKDKSTLSRGYLRNKIVGINKLTDATILTYKDLEGMTIIKLKDTNLNNLLSRLNNKKIIEVSSFDEGMNYLKSTKNSVFIGTQLYLNYYLRSENLDKKYKISQSKFEISTEMTFKDRELMKILNEVLLSYSADEIEYVANTMVVPKLNLKRFVVEGILAGVILVYIVLLIKRGKK